MDTSNWNPVSIKERIKLAKTKREVGEILAEGLKFEYVSQKTINRWQKLAEAKLKPEPKKEKQKQPQNGNHKRRKRKSRKR